MQKKFQRPVNGRVFAGVAAGLAKYFGVSVGAMRLIWVFLFIPGGVPGLVPYIILWLVMPSEGQE